MEVYRADTQIADIIIMCERMGISWEQAEQLIQRRERKQRRLEQIY